jgi:hypothetical protein
MEELITGNYDFYPNCSIMNFSAEEECVVACTKKALEVCRNVLEHDKF